VAVLLIASACSSTPETPGNAVMAYLTAADLGKESEADGRLCERLKTEASDEELATLERVTNRASVFGEGTIGGPMTRQSSPWRCCSRHRRRVPKASRGRRTW
jgi:hypothetical protein